MNLKNITWPDITEVQKFFVITLVGIILLVVFLGITDQIINKLLTSFYN